MRANTITSPVLETDSLGVGGETISDFRTIKTGNPIINGNMDIAQRGTTVAIGGGITYGLDRWKVFNTTEATFDMQQSTNVPTYAQSECKSTSSLLINPSVADTPLASNDYALLVQAIEGYNIVPLIGQTVTLSFWLYATKTGATCCKIINYGAGLEILKEFTISQSNTWEKHTWTFNLVEGQTWNTEDTGSLGINFSLGAGVDYQGAATETWSDFTYQATSNQVNHLDNASNVYRLSQVKLEIGDEATPFEGRSIQEELVLCQRYYEKSYSLGVDPGSISTLGMEWQYDTLVGATHTVAGSSAKFRVEKRTVPTVTGYSDNTGDSGKAHDWTNGVDVAVNIAAPGTTGFYWYGAMTANAGKSYSIQWTAEAEL